MVKIGEVDVPLAVRTATGEAEALRVMRGIVRLQDLPEESIVIVIGTGAADRSTLILPQHQLAALIERTPLVYAPDGLRLVDLYGLLPPYLLAFEREAERPAIARLRDPDRIDVDIELAVRAAYEEPIRGRLGFLSTDTPLVVILAVDVVRGYVTHKAAILIISGSESDHDVVPAIRGQLAEIVFFPIAACAEAKGNCVRVAIPSQRRVAVGVIAVQAQDALPGIVPGIASRVVLRIDPGRDGEPAVTHIQAGIRG